MEDQNYQYTNTASPQANPQRTTPVRRRRRKKIPKWKRMLRKYWPPIRFGLLLLLLVFVIILCVKLIAGGGKLSGQDGSAETTNGETTEPTLSQQEIEILKDAILAEAEKMAEGYDYLGAIELIQA